jgi:steroid 5-alpha reductase family enzyme
MMKLLTLFVITLACERISALVTPKSTLIRRERETLITVSAIAPAHVAAAILLPSSMGYIKREYGVSYGYGGSIAAAGYLALKAAPRDLSTLGAFHALLHVIYGVRLCLYLGFREITVPRFKEMKEKIENSAPPKRIQRTGFIVSCALLYLWMSCPLFITSGLPASTFAEKFNEGSSLLCKATWGSLYIAAVGLTMQIWGDTQKYISKAKNPKKLVTGGLYSIFRHPNYTGETLLWGGSTVAGLLTAWGVASGMSLRNKIVLSASSVLGFMGIVFVLAMAGTGLERRQKETHGDDPVYQAWVKNSWSGPLLPAKKA